MAVQFLFHLCISLVQVFEIITHVMILFPNPGIFRMVENRTIVVATPFAKKNIADFKRRRSDWVTVSPRGSGLNGPVTTIATDLLLIKRNDSNDAERRKRCSLFFL